MWSASGSCCDGSRRRRPKEGSGNTCYSSQVDDEDYRLTDGDLVEAAQPNELLRRVDALCEARQWDGLVDLAWRCREAVERGKQLWPIAEHVEYRLADRKSVV